MGSNEKINATHLQRFAYVYVRQSSTAQVQHNRESTERQYNLAGRAAQLGWLPSQVQIIDDDLARSGSNATERGGFAKMTTEVALGHVGLILSIEVSRVARNNADWYRLLDLLRKGSDHEIKNKSIRLDKIMARKRPNIRVFGSKKDDLPFPLLALMTRFHAQSMFSRDKIGSCR